MREERQKVQGMSFILSADYCTVVSCGGKRYYFGIGLLKKKENSKYIIT
jgi:hypothetical protein